MPGIIVGIDGSGHSQRALEWAMKEAAIRHAPLTVIHVHEAVAGWYGGVASYPESVTVTAVHGFPADELIRASSDADISYSAPAVRADSPGCLSGRSRHRSPRTRTARSLSSRQRTTTEAHS